MCTLGTYVRYDSRERERERLVEKADFFFFFQSTKIGDEMERKFRSTTCLFEEFLISSSIFVFFSPFFV